MTNLTPNEVARLHLKARHGTLTPEEQQVYSDYMARQLASAPPPEGGEPPKHGTWTAWRPSAARSRRALRTS